MKNDFFCMKMFLLSCLFMVVWQPLVAQEDALMSDSFMSQTLRLEMVFTGHANDMSVSLLQLRQDPHWGGPRKLLVSPFDYGDFRIEVKLAGTDSVIYKDGFSTLFEEWQTTAEAKEKERAFLQSIRMPMPAVPVEVFISKRNWDGLWEERWHELINPNNPMIIKETCNEAQVASIQKSDKPNPVDLVFLAEGYTQEEKSRFIDDVEAFSQFLFRQEPFEALQAYFSVTAVFVPSPESGTDIPGEGIFKETPMESSFYTFGSERYLTSSAIPSIRKVASKVPYDAMVILVNDDKYGGGGIFNLYAIQSAHHSLSKIVFVHEFGHSFGGLADEYYNSSVSYESYFNLNIEPWQPNITTRKNFAKKWGAMLNKHTPVPTPRTPEYNEKVGVFEGGGYVSKGVYSPMMDCRMKSNAALGFCPVCQQAIREMVLYLSDEYPNCE